MLVIIISIIFFIVCYIFFLKKWYQFFAITKVYIPDFIYSKEEFVNDTPLTILKKKKNQLMIFNIMIFIITAICFFGLTFYIMLASFALSFATCIFTFKAVIYENKIFNIFSDYLQSKK